MKYNFYNRKLIMINIILGFKMNPVTYIRRCGTKGFGSTPYGKHDHNKF